MISADNRQGGPMRLETEEPTPAEPAPEPAEPPDDDEEE
jgi:hypothetical protein